MEGDHPTAGDHGNPTLLYPVAAPAPTGLSDRLIRLTCGHGRRRTPSKFPMKPRLRFEPHHRLRKSTPLAADITLADTVSDLISHLDTVWYTGFPSASVKKFDMCIRDTSLPSDNAFHESHGIGDALIELSTYMQSLSIDPQEAEALHINENANTPGIADSGRSDCNGQDAVARIPHRDVYTSDSENGTEEVFVIDSAESSLTARRFELPRWIYNKLHTYQHEGLQWLWSLHCRGVGGILGDDMGLGKTIQVAAFLAGLFHSGLISRVLIVCPKTVLTQWNKELTFVGLQNKIKQFLGSNRSVRNSDLDYVFKEGGVLLTTYDTVRHNFQVIRGDSYNQAADDEQGQLWSYVVVDEGHMIKDPKTERAQSLHQIPCIHRIVITGTPLQNNLKEMWALFSFCCPEVLGDMEKFKTTYEKFIVKGNNKNATTEEKRLGSTVAMELREQIRPFLLRRMKGEVLFDAGPSEQTSLSNKHELVIWLKLTDFQREMYEAFLKGRKFDLSEPGAIFSAINTLKQICEHPAALHVSKYTDQMSNIRESGKFLEMIKELEDITGTGTETEKIDNNISCKLSFIMCLLNILLEDKHRVLIFSETLYMLDRIEEAIVSKGYLFFRIDGKIEMSEREKLVKEFQEGVGPAIFLLSTRVGGLGITLTNASRVVLVNPSWNPSTDSQSVDRAYRYGQMKDVVVYRLLTSGTIEEKIYKLQIFKAALFQTATKKGRPKLYFNKEETEELLSMPKEGFDISLTQKQLEEEHKSHSIDVSLRRHMEILEQQGIAGVSQHSFLFRETPVVPPMG